MLSQEELLATCEALASDGRSPQTQLFTPVVYFAAGEVSPPNESDLLVSSLREELVSYLYYLATIWLCFDTHDVTKTWQTISRARFNLLAQARQSFALSTSLAQSYVTAFRQPLMKIPNFANVSDASNGSSEAATAVLNQS